MNLPGNKIILQLDIDNTNTILKTKERILDENIEENISDF
jgi:hypothetical protein